MEVNEAGVPEVLVNICLSAVCKNIDLFNTAYKIGNKIVKEDLMFLRRFYSDEIIRRFIIGDLCLHKKYFDFLINEFLKELYWSDFRGEDLDIILEMLPRIGETVEKVIFDFNCTVEGRYQPNGKKFLNQVVKNALLHLPNVKLIQMESTSNFDDETLEVIYSSCKKLKVLLLQGEGCPISNAGLKSLCPEDKRDMFALQSLKLMSKHYTDEGVAYLLKNMPSLQYMYYHNLHNVLHELHVEDLRSNSLADVPKYKLTALRIDMNSDRLGYDHETFQETLIIAAELCPRISTLAVKLKTEEQLQILCRFSDLSEVKINGIDDTLDVSGFLQHSGKRITFLWLESCKINLAILIKNCPNLEFLRLNYCAYVSEREQSAANLKNVKWLFLILNTSLIESEMWLERLLNSCPNLEQLSFEWSCLCYQDTSDIIKRYCEKSQTLKELRLDSCMVTDELSDICDTIKAHKRGI